MENPFAKANRMEKRIKMLIWGESGSGKTTLALQFPNPVVIDCEGGTDLYGSKFDFEVLRTSEPDKILSAVDYLLRNTHPYKTLVIDPITIFWETLQKKWSDIFLLYNQGLPSDSKKMKGYKGEFFDFQPKDWMTIKQEWKELIAKLAMLDMNVIVTARAKKEYADGQMMKVIGETFDGEKTLPYVFDVIIKLWREGDKRMAFAMKDRSNSLPEENFEISYKILQDKFGVEGLTREVKTVRTEIADTLFEKPKTQIPEPVKEEHKPEPKTKAPTHCRLIPNTNFTEFFCPNCKRALIRAKEKRDKNNKIIREMYYFCPTQDKDKKPLPGCGKSFSGIRIEENYYQKTKASLEIQTEILDLLNPQGCPQKIASDKLSEFIGKPYDSKLLGDLSVWEAYDFIRKIEAFLKEDVESERMGE